MPLPAPNKPLPRTALEPVCEALANVIRQRRIACGLSLNRLAELTRLSRPVIRFIESSGRISYEKIVAFIGGIVEWRNKLATPVENQKLKKLLQTGN
ncbi:MAG TPA: helix-turn-helix transcriptional regulator [Verrucomicrobiae bacterium]